MGSTFTGLNIGLSGLNLYQTAINTTSHNIANTDTEGYTRQQTVYKAANALKVNSRYGMAGQGVQLEYVQQIRDTYYDVKFRDSNSRLGEYQVENEKLLELAKKYFVEVDKKKVCLDDAIKTVGVYNIEIKLFEGITGVLKVNVIAE